MISIYNPSASADLFNKSHIEKEVASLLENRASLDEFMAHADMSKPVFLNHGLAFLLACFKVQESDYSRDTETVHDCVVDWENYVFNKKYGNLAIYKFAEAHDLNVLDVQIAVLYYQSK